MNNVILTVYLAIGFGPQTETGTMVLTLPNLQRCVKYGEDALADRGWTALAHRHYPLVYATRYTCIKEYSHELEMDKSQQIY